jgi:hypothetical protein
MMLPPGLYLAVSLAAVGFVIGLCFVLGFRAQRRVAGACEARAAILAACPDVVISDLHVSTDGRNAVAVADDWVFLIVAIADGIAVRRYRRGEVRMRLGEGKHGAAIRIDTNDLAMPRLKTAAATPEAARLLAQRLGAPAS